MNDVPQVTIRVDFSDASGQEEALSDYLCDWPDCPNFARHELGLARQLGMHAAVCEEHAAALTRPPSDDVDGKERSG